MYKDYSTGLVMYETLDELLNAGIKYAFEDNKYFYILLEPEFLYDERAYRVDKRNNKAECMHCIDLAMERMKTNAKQIDPKTLKRAS